MKRDKLGDLTIEQLVERFVAIALEQDMALRQGQHAKYNRLFDQMETVKQELQERTGDQRQALVPLHSHPNAQVRLKSAIATLTLVPEAAQRALQTISERNEYPQAAYARDMISALDKGSYNPR
jgi:Domain of unknown function (DUF2019)